MDEKLKFASKKFTKFTRDDLKNAHPRDLAMLHRMCLAEIERQNAETSAISGGSFLLQVDLDDTE